MSAVHYLSFVSEASCQPIAAICFAGAVPIQLTNVFNGLAGCRRRLAVARATRRARLVARQQGVLVTVMQKVPLSKPLKYHDKSHKKSVTH
jgi:hypothetical protein